MLIEAARAGIRNQKGRILFIARQQKPLLPAEFAEKFSTKTVVTRMLLALVELEGIEPSVPSLSRAAPSPD